MGSFEGLPIQLQIAWAMLDCLGGKNNLPNLRA